MNIIAHRGASAYAPENTLASFQRALEMGADGIELDVQVSADSKLMVIHDADTGRTGNKRLSIAETHSQELRTVDVGQWKGRDWMHEPIPFLEEALELIPSDKALFIECKSEDPQRFIDALNLLWEKHEARLSSSTFISFHAQILRALKQEKPSATTLLLIEDLDTLEAYTEYIAHTENPVFNGIGLDKSLPINQKWAQSIKAHNQILSVWTVNTPYIALQYKAWGFNYLTTDKPNLIQKTVSAAQ